VPVDGTDATRLGHLAFTSLKVAFQIWGHTMHPGRNRALYNVKLGMHSE